ncbi:MAG: radical SAM protein [Candidatus Omnitrophica bacterium]|nr:radical SAM protein [Candidatus Omnitrophota bacterium]
MNTEEKITRLKKIDSRLWNTLAHCTLCPRACGCDRLADTRGTCGEGRRAKVYTAFLHPGEEPPISGTRGSGTIFFSGCSLRCVYCQNHQFSHQNRGTPVTEASLAEIFLRLQGKGAHNLNLVTPTHIFPQIVRALIKAFEQGLHIPIVYNSSGYESPELADLVSHTADIFLIDAKYLHADTAARYSQAPDYPECNREFLEKVGGRQPVWDGRLLRRGTVIRHLVLPGHSAESIELLEILTRTCPRALFSIMFQYRPFFRACDYPEINRAVSHEEYCQVQNALGTMDFEGWVQEFNPPEDLAGTNFPDSLEI